MLMKHIVHSLLLIIAIAAGGCIEDGFTTSPSDAPRASADTVRLGTVFTGRRTPTFRFTIRNGASKSVAINSMRLAGQHGGCFRLCVDGMSGDEFSDVEIRANDSILVLVDALLPPNGDTKPVEYAATVDFEACGVQRSVRLEAQGRDAVALEALTLTADTRLTAERPYIVTDSLVVAAGATLTIDPGAELCFHDGSYLRVYGALHSLGTAAQPVSMAGDRTGNVVADISFDIMSRQWDGVYLTDATAPSLISHTDMRNTWDGLVAARSAVELLNSRLHNSAGYALYSIGSDIDAVGCEFAEGGAGLVRLEGGTGVFNHCTFANNYLFAAIGGPAIDFADPAELSARITNSIIYGLGDDLSHGDLKDTDISLERCLLRSAGTDDDRFVRCLWDTDPMYYTERQAYVFDYRLRPESPAREAADPALTDPRAAVDAYGTPRSATPSLGAYEWTPRD